MATHIDRRAIVSSSSYLDEDVKVGPYAIIGDNVKIGASSEVGAFAQVIGNTEIGKNCQIFSYAVLGSIPQDLKYKEEKSYLVIGDNNRIREFVTVNPGTKEDSLTAVGNNNLIMAYSHIAHDCKIGNDNILANGATLAGYVEIEDRVVIGGLVAVHQFCRLGSFSIVGGCSKVVQDIPPYSMCDGHPAKIRGVNLVGLRRANFSSEVISILKKAFKILFFDNHSFNTGKEIVKNTLSPLKEIDYLLHFISSSKRGISR
jgi:UDP-N-acetylglucosamine acyltransferase